MPYFDESMVEASSPGMASAGGLVLGRRTYDIFASYWPHQGDDVPFASFLNKVLNHVGSRTLSAAAAGGPPRVVVAGVRWTRQR